MLKSIARQRPQPQPSSRENAWLMPLVRTHMAGSGLTGACSTPGASSAARPPAAGPLLRYSSRICLYASSLAREMTSYSQNASGLLVQD